MALSDIKKLADYAIQNEKKWIMLQWSMILGVLLVNHQYSVRQDEIKLLPLLPISKHYENGK